MADADQTIVQSEEEKERKRALSGGGDPPVLPGYDLQRRLGEGSFGEVWGGLQLSTGQKIAVKFLRGGGGGWTSFRHELERLRELSAHPGVVHLIDANLEASPAYFVMPWLARGSLADLLDRPAPDQALSWFEQVCHALQFTHDKGLLHCDLKPSNILLDQEGHPRLVDFGQSRLHSEATGSFGTFGYMSPEQADPDAIPTVRWDIYSLGATFYVLLTGERPRMKDSDRTTLNSSQDTRARLEAYRQLLRDRPLQPIRALQPAVDGELAALVESCLELDPARRPPGLAQILMDLERRRRGEPLLCRRPWSAAYRLRLLARRPLVWAGAALIAVSLVGTVNIWQKNRQLAELTRQMAGQNHALQQQLSTMLVERGNTLAAQDPQQAVLWWQAGLSSGQELADEVWKRTQRLRVLYHLADRTLWARASSVRAWVRFSPGGKLLLEARHGERPELVEAATGQTVATLPRPFPGSSAEQLVFSPDGQQVAVLADGGASVCDLQGREQRFLAVSDALSLAWAEQLTVTRRTQGEFVQPGWFQDERHVLHIGRERVGNAVDPSFTHDRVAVASGKQARVLRVSDGRPVGREMEHPAEVAMVCLSPDGTLLATVCRDLSLRLWELPEGTLRVARPYTTDCQALAFSPDGRLLAQSCKDGKTRLWRTEDGALRELWRTPGGVAEIVFSPDGQRTLLTRPRGGTSMHERLARPMTLASLDRPVRALALRGGTLFAAGDFGLRTLQADTLGHPQDLLREPVLDLRLSPHGLAALGKDHALVLEGDKVVLTSAEPWSCVDFSPDGRRILSAPQSADFCAERVDGQTHLLREGLSLPARWVRYGGPWTVAAATEGGQSVLTLWRDGRLARRLRVPESAVMRFELSPDGQRLAVGGQSGAVYLFDPTRDEPLAVAHHTSLITGLAFDQEGTTLASCSQDGTLRIFDGRSLAPRVNELTHYRRLPIVALAFSPDGRWVASACEDGSARVWDVESGQGVTNFLEHESPVTSLAFSGDALYTGAQDGRVRRWDLRGQSLPPFDLEKATGMELNPKTGGIQVKED